MPFRLRVMCLPLNRAIFASVESAFSLHAPRTCRGRLKRAGEGQLSSATLAKEKRERERERDEWRGTGLAFHKTLGKHSHTSPTLQSPLLHVPLYSWVENWFAEEGLAKLPMRGNKEATVREAFRQRG